MELPARRTASLSTKLTGPEHEALIEHAWIRRQRISDLVRETLRERGYLTMPTGADVGEGR